ncbi:hypothetical protein C8Q80DRAFT_1266287 [Daedaleopsis nitida]|nr:hypothetical protein C8Q80DRAFT_1266287 [Daedaleopsis nitida]
MISSHLARHVLARFAARPVARASTSSGRRFASTGAGHATKQSSDMPWMIGSAVVFGPMIAYLLSSPAKGKAHAAEHHHAKPGISTIPGDSSDSESAPKEEESVPSSSEVENSVAQAVASDSPKDSQDAEEAGSSPASDDGKVHGAPALTDSEGTTASAEEVNASMKQAFKSNLPEDAQRSEDHDTTYASGAPGQTEEAESKPDQKEKPGRSHQGTFQNEGDNGPTDLGDARQGAKSQQAPKQASEN